MSYKINCLPLFLMLLFFSGCASTPPQQATKPGESERTLVRNTAAAPKPTEPQVTEAPSKGIQSDNHKYAILIGVGKYKPPFELEGPPNDVEDLQTALVNHWGFSNDNIVKLVDEQATKKNILKEIKNLQEKTQSGDEIFVYFSGHGTSSLDEDLGENLHLPHSSGAIIPYDFNNGKDSLIVGRTDLRPLFTKLDDSGRHMLVVFDSCYSGNSVRSLFSDGKGKAKARYMKMPGQSGSSNQATSAAHSRSMSRSETYPYRNIVYIGAAQENETAADAPGGGKTFDGQAHGAFTDALLRILNKQANADLNHDGNITFQEIYEASKNMVAEQHWPQTPMGLPLNGGGTTGQAANLPLFKIAGAGVPTTSAAPNAALIEIKPLRIAVANLGADLQAASASVSGVTSDEQNPDLTFSQTSNGKLTVSTGAGDRITDELPAETAALAGWLKQRAAFDRLLKQAQARASFPASLVLGNGLAGTAVVEDDRFNFALQTQRPAYLLLLSINGQNQINVLYPFKTEELAARTANQAIYFPGNTEQDLIKATAPFGSDQLLLVAFDAQNPRPAVLEKLLGMEQLTMETVALQDLQELLASGATPYAASSLALVSVSKVEAAKLAGN